MLLPIINKKCIIISDLHLGAHNCQSEFIIRFLENIKTQKLIIAGDLFDSFNIKLNKNEWKILECLHNLDSELIWIKGNHDTYYESVIMAKLIGAEFYPDYYIFDKILILHGDIFDTFLTNHPILTNIADYFYYILQKMDKSHNLAKFMKHRSKNYLHCSEVIARESKNYANKLHCDIVCAGHSHFAIQDGNYYNSGSWTELPCTYLSIKNEDVELCTFQ